MSHRILSEFGPVVEVDKRRDKLDEDLRKLERKAKQAADENERRRKAWQEVYDEVIERDDPNELPPPEPELVGVPPLTDRARDVMAQRDRLREERREVIKAHAGTLLEQLADREAAVLGGLRDAVRLLQLGAKELDQLVTARNEVEVIAFPGQPRQQVPTDLLAVTQAVADGLDALPPKEPPPVHTTMRSAAAR